MKGSVFHRYGPPSVLKIEELPIPQPKKGEVQIKVIAATVTAGDCELRRFDIKPSWWLPLRIVMGIFSPRIKTLGQELAGVITKLGQGVEGFKVGDRVFSPCDINMGAYAEFNCLKTEPSLTKIPDKLGYKEAATIPTGGLNSLYFLKLAKIQPGQTVLINGAGGSIGTYGIQLSKLYGAEVTAVDSEIKLDTLKYLGADHVIDFEKEDFTTGSKKYDVVFDVAGKTSLLKMLRVVNEGGCLIDSNPSPTGLLLGVFTKVFTRKRLLTGLADAKRQNLEHLARLMEEGKINAQIDKEFELDQIVAAHEYVENGLKRGNVTITIEG